MTIPPTRIVISEITGGMNTYDPVFLLDNISFPQLINALCYRKRIIKKTASSRLGRLQRTITSTGSNPIMTLDGSGDGSANLVSLFSLEATSSIAPGSISFTDGTNTFTEPATPDGTLVGTPGGTGTINYATGAITITGGDPGQMLTGTFGYYPGLPCLGIESFESDKTPTAQIDFPVNVFFDQTYAYQFNGTFYDVSFYKGTGNPVTWTGQNYQQFFSSNYYRAMFVTNNKPGMQFGWVHSCADQGPSTTITMVIYNYQKGGLGYAPLTTLVVNDYLFFNQGLGTTFTPNMNSGYVSDATGSASGTYVITFATSQTTNTYTADSALCQLMTNGSSGIGDGIRWYDGDPTGMSMLGWVNFAPPLDDKKNASTPYLIGARMILPFGNRLLAIGTFEATSAQIATPTYYGNRIRYCEVTATPFYSLPIPDTLPPPNVEPNAWISNIQGFGGFVDLDTTQRILSASVTQGSLILGLESEQRRMSLTGVETDPFNTSVINPEYGSVGTFAIIPMDQGILTVGEYGFLSTSSYDSKRFDEKIIDQIFSISAVNNGFDRICGGRDFKNEVIYFTFPSQNSDASNIYPDQTVVFNYREGSFALWLETFTTYGLYKIQTGETWSHYYTPWKSWDIKWADLGGDQYVEPFVAGGTPQGFVMLKWDSDNAGSFNQSSMYIKAITVSGSTATITSPSHNLNSGLFVGFWDGIPGIGSMQFIGQVSSIVDIDNFVVTFDASGIPGNIVPGIWEMSIVDQINILTRQFPVAWTNAKKTRLGAQKYFLDTTTEGEFTVNLLGSQSPIPLNGPSDTPLYIFSQTVRTRPDASLGLSDNTQSQAQIWHRLAANAIGDTIQLQMTMSDAQMYNIPIATSPWVLYSIILDVYPSRTLA
jgi:hypothetical protein